MLTHIFTILYYAWVGLLLVTGGIYTFTHHDWIKSYRSMNIRLYLWILPLVGIIMVISYALLTLDPALFGFSWLRLVGSLVGLHTRSMNINFAGITIPFIGILICVFLASQLPGIAHREEIWFRKGTRTWKDGLVRSILFGFIHMLLGVPLAVVPGLVLAGLFFTRMYFKGGIDLSAQAHFQYDVVVLSIAFMIAIIFTVTAFT